jgi:hypothetical protein
MDTIEEVFEDWTEVTDAKRLRGCILHAARVLRRDGQQGAAQRFEDRVKRMPRHMTKENINYVLMAACLELGIIKA